MCEQFGVEPDPQKMPLDPSVFPEEVHVAFFILSLLPDRWEGMSGTYMGKDWNSAKFLYDMYEVDDPQTITYLAKLYEGKLVGHRAEQQKQKEKQRQAKSNSSTGKHTVKRG